MRGKFIQYKPVSKENNDDKYITDFISNLDKIDDILELEDAQIIMLRDKLKEIEVKLKEKAKPKTITISSEAHNIIKSHCLKNNKNLGDWAENILINSVNCNNFLLLIENSITINGTFPNVLPGDYISKYVETQALPIFKDKYGIEDIFNPFFIKYIIGWAKVQQGNLFSRYDYSLPGGIKINHEEMILDGQKDMHEVEEHFRQLHLSKTKTYF